MNIAEWIIPAVASIIVAAISVISAYLLSKNPYRMKSRITNNLKVKDEILKPLYECLPMDEILNAKLDTIIKDVKLINKILTGDFEHYLLTPPEITFICRDLMHIINNAEQRPAAEWATTLEKDIRKKYRRLRKMIYRFQNVVRKNMCYPTDTTFQTIKYGSDEPVFTIYVICTIAIFWMLIMSAFAISNNTIAIMIYLLSSLAIFILIFAVKLLAQKCKEKRYFRSSIDKKA